jgi:integrase
MPRLKTVRPKWALTVDQAMALGAQLPWLLPRTMVGLALLTGLRRGELFALGVRPSNACRTPRSVPPFSDTLLA